MRTLRRRRTRALLGRGRCGQLRVAGSAQVRPRSSIAASVKRSRVGRMNGWARRTCRRGPDVRRTVSPSRSPGTRRTRREESRRVALRPSCEGGWWGVAHAAAQDEALHPIHDRLQDRVVGDAGIHIALRGQLEGQGDVDLERMEGVEPRPESGGGVAECGGVRIGRRPLEVAPPPARWVPARAPAS